MVSEIKIKFILFKFRRELPLTNTDIVKKRERFGC